MDIIKYIMYFLSCVGLFFVGLFLYSLIHGFIVAIMNNRKNKLKNQKLPNISLYNKVERELRNNKLISNLDTNKYKITVLIEFYDSVGIGLIKNKSNCLFVDVIYYDYSKQEINFDKIRKEGKFSIINISDLS